LGSLSSCGPQPHTNFRFVGMCPVKRTMVEVVGKFIQEVVDQETAVNWTANNNDTV